MRGETESRDRYRLTVTSARGYFILQKVITLALEANLKHANVHFLLVILGRGHKIKPRSEAAPFVNGRVARLMKRARIVYASN